MALPQFQAPPLFEEYVTATSLEMALQAMADGNAVPVAGGTDLWVQKATPGAVEGQRLVNIRRVPELAGISEDDGIYTIGALVTVTDVLEDDCLRAAVPILPAAADKFASMQIRNAATIGGNIANGSPAADMIVPLMCLDAICELACWREGQVVRREVPIREMFTGPGQTVRLSAELLTRVRIAAPRADHVYAFCKTGPRPALEIARVSMGFLAGHEDGTLIAPRLAFGAVAPIPLRCPNTEALLNGAPLNDDLIARALETMDGEISPISDHRASEWYRRHLARTYLEQELRHVRNG